MKLKLFLSIIISVLISVTAVIAQKALPVADVPQGYLIGPGDEISGKVLGEEQFDFTSTVDEDGKIEVPFFDKPVVAVCKTERDLRLEIAKLLGKYLKSPQLSVRVTKRNRPPVSIYGEVRQQQQVILTRRANLLELISASGGVTEKSGGMVQVFRTRPPVCAAPEIVKEWQSEKTDSLGVPSKLYSLAGLRQGKEDANPEIFPGDIIVVAKAAPVYVVGEVVKPGELSIPDEGLPLTQAVAMSSGITRQAKKKEIKIYRRKPGSSQPELILADFAQIRQGTQKDFMLQPFDIVEVGTAKKSISDYLIELATGIPNRIPIPIY